MLPGCGCECREWVRGDDALAPWYEASTEVLPPLQVFDVHTRVGAHEPDGFRLDADQLLRALEPPKARAVMFSADTSVDSGVRRAQVENRPRCSDRVRGCPAGTSDWESG
jgi:hypothetical protein